MAARARYSTDDDRVLVDTLTDQAQNKGQQSENGFKSPAYIAAAAALVGSELVSGGAAKTASSCRDRFTALKKQYCIVKKLRELSGFGWDEERSLVVAPYDVWERYIAAHPDAKKWRKTPFPLFDAIAALVDGTTATGEFVFRPGQGRGRSDDGDTEHSSSPSPSPSPSRSGTPTPSGRKRAASSPAPLRRSRKRNGKLTAADTVSDLVRVVGDLKDALIEPSPDPIIAPSPQRRKMAIQALAGDSAIDLTPRRKVKLIMQFRKETSIADTYLALTDDDVLRAGYLQEELDSI